MATTTPNIGLTLPIGTENVSRQIINTNNTKIDTAIGTLNSKRQLTITAGAHTVIDENDSYICGKVMVINFKCHSTSDISSSETIATIEETTIFDCVVPLFIGGAWSVSGALYGYVTGKSVIAGSINNGQYVHVNFTTLLA